MAPTQRIDHREASLDRHGGARRVCGELGERCGSARERLVCQMPILAEPSVDGIGRKEEEGTVRTSHPPTAISRDEPGAPRVPRERAVNPAEVVDLGLHLDHKQRSRLGVKRQDIDPSRAVSTFDLDLRLDEPSEPPKTDAT